MNRLVVFVILVVLAATGSASHAAAPAEASSFPNDSMHLESPVVESSESPAAPRVDVNTAGTAELESLPGIGPALARRIIDHRKAEGPFEKVEDLLEVKGIGPKMLSRLRDRVTVSAPGETGR